MNEKIVDEEYNKLCEILKKDYVSQINLEQYDNL